MGHNARPEIQIPDKPHHRGNLSLPRREGSYALPAIHYSMNDRSLSGSQGKSATPKYLSRLSRA